MKRTRVTLTLRQFWIPACLALTLALFSGCGKDESKQAKTPQAAATQTVAAAPAATGEAVPPPAVASPVSDDQSTTETSAVADAATTETLGAESDTVADDIPSTAPRLVLSGRVTMKGTGEPAKGAKVELSRYDYSAMPDLKTILAGSAVTDTNGRYRMTVQDSPFFRVTASKGGTGKVVDQLMDQAAMGQVSKQTGVRKVEKDFVLPPNAVVSGKVVDEQDKPVKDVKVVAFINSNQGGSGMQVFVQGSETTSDAEGRFRFDDLQAGPLSLGVDSESYVSLKVEATAPAEDVVLRLQSEGGTLSGHVYLKSTGAAVSEADVVVYENPKPPRYYMQATRKPMKTGADGSFRFDRLAAGDYRIQVSKAPLVQVPDKKMEGDANKIVLGEKEKKVDLDFFLYPGMSVRGKVTMKDTGEPVEGVVVRPAWGRDPEKSASTTGPNGEYVIVGVSGSQIGILAEKKGLAMVKDSPHMPYLQVPLDPDKTEIAQNIEMTRAVTVSGTVKTESGAPVSNAQVSVFSQNWSARQKKTPVEADGTYILDADPFSPLRVRAEAPDYPVGVSDTVSIEDVPVTGVDIVLKRGGTVSGTVKTPDGNPAAGATVQAMMLVMYGNRGSSESVGTATADGSGKFLITGLPNLEVSLSASQPGFASSGRTKITLSAGEVKSGIALQLRVSHFIAGHVTDGEGNPLASVHVQAYASGGSDDSNGNATTDADGRYRIEGLADAIHRMHVWGNDQGSDQKESVEVDQDNVDFVLGEKNQTVLIGTVVDATTKRPIAEYTVGWQYGGGANVEKDPDTPGRFTLKNLQGGVSYQLSIKAEGYADYGGSYFEVPKGVESFEKTFEMGRGGTLTGRVVEKSSGNPLAGVRIFLRGTGNAWDFRNRPPQATANTGDDGRFQFTGVSAGQNQIEFHPTTPLVVLTQSADVKNDQTTDMGDVELTGGGIVRGRVIKDPGGVPQPGIEVELLDQMHSAAGRKATTDANGAYEFTGVPGASYVVSTAKWSLRSYFQLADGETRQVVLRVGTATLRGRAMRGGKPISANANLSLSGESLNISANSGGDGVFEMTDLAPGSYSITVQLMGEWQTRLQEQITLTAGQVLERDFLLPNSRIVGRVVDAEGKPVRGATIRAQSPTFGAMQEPFRDTESQTDGSFKVDGIPPGTYSVTASHPDQGMAAQDGVEVPPDGESAPVELRIDSANGGTVISVALDMEGNAVQMAWCKMTARGGTPFNPTTSRGPDGTLKLVGVPPGTYDMEVSYWGYSISTRVIEVKAGESQTYEDVLYRAGALRWTLKDKNEKELVDIPCTLTPNDPSSIEEPRAGKTASSGPDIGQFVVRGLFPGEYTAKATLPDGQVLTETITIVLGTNALAQVTTHAP